MGLDPASGAVRRQDGHMSEDRDLEAKEEEASLDSAVEAATEHDLEREAAHKQGLIEKETREHGLDES